jgi:PAS domain S-box-containing protein
MRRPPRSRPTRLGSRRGESATAIRPVGSALNGVPHRTSGVRLTVVALGTTALAATGVAAVTPAHDTAVAVGCIVVLAVCSHLALRFAASSRDAYRRCADDASELIDIIDEIGAVVCVRDADGHYLLVNRQFEQLYGVSREESLGRRHQDVFPGSDSVIANDRKALTKGTPVQTQETVDQIDGPHSYFTVRHPVAGRAGHAYAVCVISTDITDLMRAESEVRTLIANLEQRVRDRTADLEASNRENQAFTYSASHDLRAPLRAVISFSEILLEDYAEQLDPIGRDYLHRMSTAATRMAATIDGLLDLSDIGRSELLRRPVELGELAREVLDDLRTAEPGRNVEAVIERLPAQGDPRQLRLVIQNLVTNAWKFTRDNSNALIRIGTRDHHGVPAYYVEDNGTGFDMKYADKLFAPFQRLHSPAEYPGTGIGLAIVERVVERHGGRVWAESSVGGGATFYFTLARFPAPVGTGDPGH